jgi:excisionase family DNA binding protein
LSRLLYSSIVRLCDQIRVKYNIPDRRPKLSNPILRHRDEDLLPFPWSDTMDTTEALTYIGYESRKTVYNLIEEGRFEAYRLVGEMDWRISRSSFAAFLAALRNSAPKSGVPYGRIAKLDHIST